VANCGVQRQAGKKDKQPTREAIYRKSGLLRYPVPQPAFLADPAHRKKTFKNKLYSIKGTSVRVNHGIQDGDILRLTLYYAYFIRQLKDKPEEEWVESGKALVDHHFDSHDFCGEWCKRKKETEEEKLQSKKQYRDKNRDHGLYSLLCGAIAPFISLPCLKEVGHGANTNVNESLNQTISWLAPKNRTYCGSMSLRNRVGMAVSVHLVGFDTFYNDLFRHLGLHVDPHLACSLSQTQRERLHQLQQKQSKVYKEKRRASYFEKMKQYFAKIEDDRQKGTNYLPGVAFDDTNMVPVDETASIVRCKRCGGVGHKTANSKMCRFHRSRVSAGIMMQNEEVPTEEARKKRSNVSSHDSVHDSRLLVSTEDPTSISASANQSNMTSSESRRNHGGTQIASETNRINTAETTEKHASDRPEISLFASVNFGSETTEMYQLSIVDTVICSTDLNEVGDPEVRNFLTDLMEE